MGRSVSTKQIRWLVKMGKTKKKIKRPLGLRIKEWAVRNKHIIQFCIIFFVVLFSLHYLYIRYTYSKLLMFYARIAALTFGGLLRIFGVDVSVVGNIISFNQSMLNIGPECTNLACLMVYFAGVIAYPTSLKNRGLGLLYGTVILYLVNILRLGLLTIAEVAGGRVFDFIHSFLWPTLFIIFGIIVWVWWIDHITRRKKPELTRASLFVFFGKFLLFATILLGVWLLLSKYYMIFLAKFSHGFLRWIIGYKIEGAGLLDTPSLIGKREIYFLYQHVRLRIPWVHSFTFNLIPFAALILATPIKLVRQAKLILIGFAILFFFHFLRVILPAILYFSFKIQVSDLALTFANIFTAVLPFLLWFVLAYRQKIVKK
jgi:exosortase/archaeosortase family protein